MFDFKQCNILKKMVADQKNILIAGAMGSEPEMIATSVCLWWGYVSVRDLVEKVARKLEPDDRSGGRQIGTHLGSNHRTFAMPVCCRANPITKKAVSKTEACRVSVAG